MSTFTLAISSFFLELFLHWSPAAYWAPTDLGSSSFSVFSYCPWGSQGKNSEVVCHSLLQWTTFCQTSPPWSDHLGWPHTAWLSFTELDTTAVLWSHWLVFCDYDFRVSALWCPLITPTILLGFLLPRTWGNSLRLLQQSAAAAPYFGRGVSPQGRPSWPWMQRSIYSRLWFFQWSCMDVRVGLWRKLKAKELKFQRIDVFELWCWRKLLSPLNCKEIQPVHPKGDQSWVFIGRTDAEAETNTLATWCEELTHWKRLWCWEGLGAGGEGDDKRWDGWMASPTRWTWVWVNSGSRWWIGRPGVLRFMGSQRVRLDWATELNWTFKSVNF